MTLRLAIVNPVWAPDLRSPDELIDRYGTLTGWARAVAATGIDVTVVQRLPYPAVRQVDGVSYVFVADAASAMPAVGSVAPVASAVAAVAPDVVHVNGVVFPRWMRALRRRMSAACRLVVQDHGGWHPEAASVLARLWIRRGLASADAVLMSSPGHAATWRRRGVLPRHVPVHDVMESSVDMRPMPRDLARRESGVEGRPAILCVGRLTRSKDPMTVLDGFTRFAAASPGATLTWVFHGGELEGAIRQAVVNSVGLARRVRLVGVVPRQRMAAFYSAADIVLSASRAEGSGYAALEAMACGAIPALTDIPSFRAMTGDGAIGALWRPADAQACAEALDRATMECGNGARVRVRARFDEALAWPVVGRRAAGIYRAVCGR